MKYTKTNLKNGLTFVQIPMDGVKSVTVLALVNVGSRYEDSSISGIFHFLEHMVFKGTKRYPTAHDVAATVDSVGAEFNAFTSKEYTGYYVKSASRHVHVALDVVSDMLLTPQLREGDLEREKGVIIEEINMYEDIPMKNIGNIFERMFYKGSGLGRDVIGTKQTVSSITQSDFKKYLQQWYGLSNVVLVIAGDIDVVEDAKLVDSVEEYFSKGDDTRNTKSIHRFKKGVIHTKDRIHIEYKKTEQVHFVLGFPGFSRKHKDRYVLSVLSTLLGGNMSSRLFTEVREKRGLCYYIRSDVNFYHDVGFFGVQAGVDPNRVEEAIKVTLDQFIHLVDGTVAPTEQELQKAKDYTIGHLVLGMEDSQSVALGYGLQQVLENKIRILDEIMEKITQVSMKDIVRVAKSCITLDQVRFALIGPCKEQEKFQKILQL